MQTTFGMEIAGTTAVASAPPRPGKHQFGTTRRRPDELSQHMTHFRNGERKQWSSRRGRIKKKRGECTGGEVSCPLLSTDPGQEGMRQHAQGDMAIPADPTADFVVVESQVFGRFKVFFNMPAGADSLDHLLQGGSLWGKDEVVRFLSWVADAATNE